jgi:hypothetical protein
VLAEQRAVRAQKQRRAVQRAAVTLDDADDEVHALLARDRPEPVNDRSRNIDR